MAEPHVALGAGRCTYMVKPPFFFGFPYVGSCPFGSPGIKITYRLKMIFFEPMPCSP